MLSFFDPLRGVDTLSVAFKLLTAMVLGGMIGLERSYKNRTAGIRAHVLVSTGSAIAALADLYMHLVMELPVDITRISASVVAGLSFLGVGTIIVTKNYTVKGLTTSAGLWVSGIIGLAVGSGFFEGAVLTAVLVLVAEGGLVYLKDNVGMEPVSMIEVIYKKKDALDHVMTYFRDHHISVSDIRIISDEEGDDRQYLAFLSLNAGRSMKWDSVMDELTSFDGIVEIIELEQPDES